MKKKGIVFLILLLIVSILVFTGCSNTDENADANGGDGVTNDMARESDDVNNGLEDDLMENNSYDNDDNLQNETDRNGSLENDNIN